MLIGILQLELRIGDALNLKEKRRIVRSLTQASWPLRISKAYCQAILKATASEAAASVKSYICCRISVPSAA